MRTVEEIARMAIADEVEPRPARAHAVARLTLRHRIEGAGRTPFVYAACHCATDPAAASEAIHARVRGVAKCEVARCEDVRTALVAAGCIGVHGLRLEGRACVVAKGEAEPAWPRRYARRNHVCDRARNRVQGCARNLAFSVAAERARRAGAVRLDITAGGILSIGGPTPTQDVLKPERAGVTCFPPERRVGKV